MKRRENMKALKISLTLMAIIGTAHVSASTKPLTRSASNLSVGAAKPTAAKPVAAAQGQKNNKWFFGLF